MFRISRGAAGLLSISLYSSMCFSSARSDNKEEDKFPNFAMLTGCAGRKYATEIANVIGCPLANVSTKRFSDGETLVLLNDSVRGKHVYIVQTCAAPIGDNIIELLQIISTARNSGADRVTAVIPYFGYKFHQ
jgi:ribose-phosphate pyrophosphokinase